MQIERTSDGRYIKVLSPELKGTIGRMYQEIRDRKNADELFLTHIEDINGRVEQMTSDLEVIELETNDLLTMFRTWFPKNSDTGIIEKNIVVTESLDVTKKLKVSDSANFLSNVEIAENLVVKGNGIFEDDTTFDTSIEVSDSILTNRLDVSSAATLENLTVNRDTTLHNAKVNQTIDVGNQVQANSIIANETVLARQLVSNVKNDPPLVVSSSQMVSLLNAEYINNKSLEDIVLTDQFELHIGAKGEEVHGTATTVEAGFMSSEDKRELNRISAGTQTIPVQNTAPNPSSTTLLWVDTSDIN